MLLPALMIWLGYSIYRQVTQQEHLESSLELLQARWASHGWLMVSMVTALMLVNWGIEAQKWKRLMKPVEQISFFKSFKAILAGVAFSSATPNRIGEYVGRVMYLKQSSTIRAVVVTIVGNFSQILATLGFGWMGLLYYNFMEPTLWSKLLLVALTLLMGLAAVFYFRIDLVVVIAQRVSWFRKTVTYLQVIRRISQRELVHVLVLSVVRYMVFTAQYLFLLYAMGAEMPLVKGFMMISLYYLVLMMVPTVTIADLGVRGETSLAFLGKCTANTVGILSATAAIWFVNLIVPAVMGLLFLALRRIRTGAVQPELSGK